jgi:solute carrier family 25 oxoglutarate transporter 11
MCRSLFNGFGPYFARSGGHTVFMFLFMEQYVKIANSVYPP